MGFEEALERNPAPQKVGHVRLRYESSLLIGEETLALASFWVGPEWMLAGGLVAALGAVVALLIPGVSLFLAFACAALAAVLVFFATRWEHRKRKRSFVLNFATESLRLDSAGKTVTVHFDAVTAVDIMSRPDGRLALEVTFERGNQTESALLIDSVAPEDVEALRRVWKVIRAAVGLGATPSALS